MLNGLTKWGKSVAVLEWDTCVTEWDLDVLSLIRVHEGEARKYFKHYVRFLGDVEDKSQSRMTRFLMHFDCERDFLSLHMFNAGSGVSGKGGGADLDNVSFVQFVFTVWHICLLSLDDLYRLSFTAFDLSHQDRVAVDDLPAIFHSLFGDDWRCQDGPKQAYLQLHHTGLRCGLLLPYAKYREAAALHTSFATCLFRVHSKVREEVFGERHWTGKAGHALSGLCVQRGWDRARVMELVKFNSAESISRAMYSRELSASLQGYTPHNDCYLDRWGTVLPGRDDERGAGRRNPVHSGEGEDRTAWVSSSAPRRERAKHREAVRQEQGLKLALGVQQGGRVIPELEEVGGELLGVDLHDGYEEHGREDRDRFRIVDRDMQRDRDNRRDRDRVRAVLKETNTLTVRGGEVVVDRLATRRLLKAGRRLKECHQYARACEMPGYIQEEVPDGSDAGTTQDRPRVTFSREEDYEGVPEPWRAVYDECVRRPQSARPSREHSHFPGGVAVAEPNMQNIERVNGVPVWQLIRDRHYPLEEASAEEGGSLAQEQRELHFRAKKEHLRVLRQTSRARQEADTDVTGSHAGTDCDTSAATSSVSSDAAEPGEVPAAVIPTALRRPRLNPFTHHHHRDPPRGREDHQQDHQQGQQQDQQGGGGVTGKTAGLYLVRRTEQILEQHRQKSVDRKYTLKSSSSVHNRAAGASGDGPKLSLKRREGRGGKKLKLKKRESKQSGE